MNLEENEILTRVGPGTPMGEVMRRYWWPIWFSESVTNKPVPVRLLGEDLVLFRDATGELGLTERYCAHRRASLQFGRVEPNGIRCCYHGWLFDRSGRCLETPMEPDGSTLKDDVGIAAYKTQEVCGLIFAYLGPDPAPVLPPYDLLHFKSAVSDIGAEEEHCNWLQRAENLVDQYHLTVLHASVYPDMALKRPFAEWERTWYGIRVRSSVSGRAQAKISHFIFPSVNRFTRARIGDVPSHRLRYRVPVDDTKTHTFFVHSWPNDSGELELRNKGLLRRDRLGHKSVDDGWWGIASDDQDRVAQESQGLITDRSREYLGTTDRGIVLLRQMIHESIQNLEKGKDPVGVLRDPSAFNVIDLDASMDEIGALTG